MFQVSRYKLQFIFGILFIVVLLFIPFAYINAAPCTTLICNPIDSDSFEDFIVALIRTFTVFAAPILALMVGIAGFQLMVSGGNPGKREKAMNTLKYSVIGFTVIIAAWIIVSVLKGIF